MTNPRGDVRVYIEGDGHAFNNRGRPTADPTPQGGFMRKLAFNDPNDNVIYMARPCQFVADPKCEKRYWTTARFAPEVITAAGQAIIKSVDRRQPIILIGYSGGAQVAGQVVTRKFDGQFNVEKIITIAGVLDHKAWTAYHNDTPLKESPNLADYRTAFSRWPQIHYVGGKDDVVPPALVRKFITDPGLIVIVPNATHNKGWEEILPELYKR